MEIEEKKIIEQDSVEFRIRMCKKDRLIWISAKTPLLSDLDYEQANTVLREINTAQIHHLFRIEGCFLIAQNAYCYEEKKSDDLLTNLITDLVIDASAALQSTLGLIQELTNETI